MIARNTGLSNSFCVLRHRLSVLREEENQQNLFNERIHFFVVYITVKSFVAFIGINILNVIEITILSLNKKKIRFVFICNH